MQILFLIQEDVRWCEKSDDVDAAVSYSRVVAV